jgi:GTPase SAR1 family protein
VISGPTGSGKSVFVRRFVHNIQHMMMPSRDKIWWCYDVSVDVFFLKRMRRRNSVDVFFLRRRRRRKRKRRKRLCQEIRPQHSTHDDALAG